MFHLLLFEDVCKVCFLLLLININCSRFITGFLGFIFSYIYLYSLSLRTTYRKMKHLTLESTFALGSNGNSLLYAQDRFAFKVWRTFETITSSQSASSSFFCLHEKWDGWKPQINIVHIENLPENGETMKNIWISKSKSIRCQFSKILPYDAQNLESGVWIKERIGDVFATFEGYWFSSNFDSNFREFEL